MFVIDVGHCDFICKGSYVVHGEKYQIVGRVDEAIKFKTEQSAINYVERMWRKRANMCGYEIVEWKEEQNE